MGTYYQMMRRVIAALIAAVAVVAVTPALAGVPAVYRLQLTDKVGKGVVHRTYTRTAPAEVVNVAHIKSDAPFELRAVPAMGGVGNGLERTSSICKRVGCALAVNGDFWRPGTDLPIGGVVSRGRLLRTPSTDHAQVTIAKDGTLRTGPLRLVASLIPEDLRPMTIAAVNRPPRGNEIVLFTPAAGPSTRTKKGTVEVEVRADKGKNVLNLARTIVVRVAQRGSEWGNMPIPPGGAVVSGTGRGGRLLKDLLQRIRADRTSPETLLRLESRPSAVESIGGSPVLVRNGKLLPRPEDTAFVRGRHPRTLIGWTKSGEVLLVTVDGRQAERSAGMTLVEAGRFMRSLGAIEAVNLDGGGSTTFVSRGQVVNRPSDRAVQTSRGQRIVHEPGPGEQAIGFVERPVAMAVAVVPKKSTKVAAPARGRALNTFESIPISDAAAPHASDVASNPEAGLPAIVHPVSSKDDRALRIAAVAIVGIAIALAAASWGYFHGRRHGAAQAK